jgi:hypothetical protein
MDKHRVCTLDCQRLLVCFDPFKVVVSEGIKAGTFASLGGIELPFDDFDLLPE